MKLHTSILRKRLHLVTGMCLGFFLLTHFSNHALGLISVDAMEGARSIFTVFWRSWIGTILLYGSLAAHFAIALESLYRRQTLRMPAREAIRIAFGLLLPFLLVGHVVATRVDWSLSGFDASYRSVLPGMWFRPYDALEQSVALVFAWSHGCLGLWFWMRGKSWYRRAALPLYSLALLIPILALLGFAIAARSLPAPTGYAAGRADPQLLGDIRFYLLLAFTLLIGGTLLARAIPVRGRIRIQYPDGKIVSVAKGFSVLEASRAAGIAHLSICGGHGRCSTCRVRITAGLQSQPAPSKAETLTLRRIRAPANVRLACQLRPSRNLTLVPVLDAGNVGIKGSPSEEEAAGLERRIAVLFCDLRDFTLLAQQKLPFDTVFLLNRYFETIGAAIESAGGVIDKFIGDGALAVFGLNASIEEACTQALDATVRIARGIEVLNRNFTSELDKPLRVAMGMHAGPAIIGKIGYGRAMALTAVGDTINAASRLEGFAKEYDAQLAVSADVLRYAGIDLDGHKIYDIVIRGRAGTLSTMIIDKAGELETLMAERHTPVPTIAI